jgi:energy-coupling factor transporter ATP-binding protein EcfA2
MNNLVPHLEAIETLVLSSERMNSFAFSKDATADLLNYTSLVAMRHHLHADRPVMIGFIGCTGTGKSTIFNSLIGKMISETGWQAHNTCGPVLYAHRDFWNRLLEKETAFVPLLLPRLKRETCFPSQNGVSGSSGSADRLHMVFVDDPGWKNHILIDLPDINTTLAKDEQLIAQTVMPWLDLVIFLVDDETLYHREYERPSAYAKEIKQPCICVLNNRGKDRIELDHPDVKGVMRFFGVDTIHVLPQLSQRNRFTDEPAFLALKKELFSFQTRANFQPVLQKCKTPATQILEENRSRKISLMQLERRVSEIIDEELAQEQPISFRQILDDDVISALNHLGLKRFAISNMFQFLKRLGTTGSLKRSFQIAFGQNREQALSQVLAMDVDKIENEIVSRLIDHCEKISTVLHRHEASSLIFGQNSDFKSLTFVKKMPIRKLIEDITRNFEKECRETLAVDSLSGSIKNDPLLTASVLVMLLADVFVIPGFGTWLLVPSAFKFLPLGKFEKIKRRFQQSIKDVIQEALSQVTLQLQATKSQLILEDRDPLLTALTICAAYDDH